MKRPLIREWFPTIRSRLLAVLVVCVVLPLTCGQLWMHFVTRRSLEASEIQKYRSLTVEAARQVGARMRSAESNLMTLSQNPVLVTPSPSATEKEWIDSIRRIAEAAGIFTDISLFRSNGNLIESTSQDYRDPQEHTRWFSKAVEGKTTLSAPQPVLARPDGSLDVAVYVPVKLPNSKKLLVARGRVQFDDVVSLLKNVDLGEGGRMVLVDARNIVLAHPDEAQMQRRYHGPGDAVGEGETHGETIDATGQKVVWIAERIGPDQTRVEDETWTLLTIIPKDNILALASQSSMIHLGAGLATLLSVVGLGYVFARRITSPLVTVAQAAERLAHGDIHSSMDQEEGPVETRQLARAFNSMVSEVVQHRTDLERLVALRTLRLQEQQARAHTLSAQLRAAFEATEEAILILQTDGVVLSANRQFGCFFGLPTESLAGNSFATWQDEFFSRFADATAFADRWQAPPAPAAGRQSDMKWHLVQPERRVLVVYASPLTAEDGSVLGQLWVFRDLTQEQELRDSLEQSQKMEAIGRLAGGVAHDFNNLLTGILGNLSLADAHLCDRSLEEPRQHIHYARSAAERAAQLVKGLLGFSRRSHLQLSHCDLNTAIRNFHPLIQRVIDPRIAVKLDLATSLWGVHADLGKIEQVLMNLCVNARDAIDAVRPTGAITIRTSNEQVGSSTTARRFQAVAGDHVCLSVTDTGSGMTPEVMEKIFEPFFTTKEQGKGTGLGLATSYGIVQQHGGWIDCESTPGRGTTFRVFLPRNDYVEPLEVTAPENPGDIRGDETILVVDDEVMVRMVAETLLKSHGYQVLTAADGQEAVDLYRARGREISLILMDMTMPRMSGFEAFAELRAMDRLVPVVICSGYLVDLGECQTANGDHPNGFVQKPYDLRELVTTVRHLIDAASASSRGKRRTPRSAALSV